jgi:hypothetical protein
MRREGTLIIFDVVGDDEQPFKDWVADPANANGFIANVGHGGQEQEDVLIHQPSCGFMTSSAVAKAGYIGPMFYKVCSLDGHALAQWAEREYRAGRIGVAFDHQTSKCSPNLIGRVRRNDHS